ncbi:ICP0-binding domain of ubiquitin-specific protease 7-domain-containing protein [Gigaspora rosea]|uniref:ICP0-binding domain of ubiquitin-specific protease 7-domain-containing protein n=1 Tax=Gigaspora rosea TaxID=44941 RepID=A0A397VG42_9GLOM|nr:ICP0-binding domain of ubiquitin-specific protease 7-domain-containing protein [Gigaspora rosea]
MDYIRKESCEGDNKFKTETYGLQEAEKGVIFESFPSVLRIYLKRHDMQGYALISDRYEYPPKIDLQKYLSPDNSDRSKPNNYLLYGVIVQGDFYGSTYYVFLKPEKNGKWFKFDNDDIVTPTTDKEVFEDNYGGKDYNNTKRFRNAYMLMYIRESDIDLVLSPVLVQDIPKHLQRRMNGLYEQKKKKKAKDSHLYLHTMIVTPETFARHQGFDLANFDDQRYQLSEIPQFNVLKSETYKTFKTMTALKFGYRAEQIRFWVFVNRQNKTVRPDTLIIDNFFGMTMEEIHTKMAAGQNDLKLFLEAADKPINDHAWFPHTGGNSPNIIVFIKYFKPNTQSLEGLGYLYVQKLDKVCDIIPILCEKKEFPPHTPLKIYKEIKPNMIEEMIPNMTFLRYEIQNVENRIREIPAFYDSLLIRNVIQFKPKYEGQDQNPEFEIVLKKNQLSEHRYV